MAGNVICPPGVLVGGYGEDAKNNSLVDHHHLLPSLHVSIIVPSREIRCGKPHCGLLQHIALGRTDSGRIYNHILLVTGKQRKAIVIKHEWSCGKGALKPVSLSVADSCLTLGHSGCFLHAPKQKFLPPDGRFSWFITIDFFKLQKWEAASKLSVVTSSTVRSPVGFKWDFCSLQLFIWLFWTHPDL